MISYRTIFLLISAAACGIGSGVLGVFYDGLACSSPLSRLSWRGFSCQSWTTCSRSE